MASRMTTAYGHVSTGSWGCDSSAEMRSIALALPARGWHRDRGEIVARSWYVILDEPGIPESEPDLDDACRYHRSPTSESAIATASRWPVASGKRIRCRNVETEPTSSGKKRLGRQSYSSPASGTFAGPTKSLARLSPTMVLAQEVSEWMETRLVPFHPRSIGSPTASAEVGHGFASLFHLRTVVQLFQARLKATAQPVA